MSAKSPILTDAALNANLANKRMLGAMVDFIASEPNHCVLDLGTGKGNTAIALAPHVRDIQALDYSEEIIGECQKNIRKAALESKITAKIGDVANLDYENESFDLVTCRAAFHHFLDPLSVLKEAKRVLKPRGKFYLSDAFFSEYAKQVWMPIAKIRETDLNTYYTYLDIYTLFISCGFEIVKIRPFLFQRDLDEWASNASWLEKASEEIRDSFEKRLKDIMLNLDERIRNELHFEFDQATGKRSFSYNAFELLAINS